MLAASPPIVAYNGPYNDPYKPKTIPTVTTQLTSKTPFTEIHLDGLSFACTRSFTHIATPCTLNITGWGLQNLQGLPKAASHSFFSDYIPKRDNATQATMMQRLSLADLETNSGSWGVNAMSFDAEAPDGSGVDLWVDSLVRLRKFLPSPAEQLLIQNIQSYITVVDGACCQGSGTCSCPS